MKKILRSLISFLSIAGLLSCYSHLSLTSPEGFAAYSARKRVYVERLVTNQNDTMVFFKNHPGLIGNKQVSGSPEIFLPFHAIDSVRYVKNTLVVDCFWHEGDLYQSFKREATGFRVVSHDTLTIPFDAIKQLDVRQFQSGNTIALIVIPSAAMIVALIISGSNMDMNMDLGGW